MHTTYILTVVGGILISVGNAIPMNMDNTAPIPGAAQVIGNENVDGQSLSQPVINKRAYTTTGHGGSGEGQSEDQDSREFKMRYTLRTKKGTSEEAFKELIAKLPKDPKASQTVSPNLKWQSYSTELPPDEAKKLQEDPIVAFIIEDEPNMESDNSQYFHRVKTRSFPEDSNLFPRMTNEGSEDSEGEGDPDMMKNIWKKKPTGSSSKNPDTPGASGSGSHEPPPPVKPEAKPEIEQQLESPDHLGIISQGPVATNTRGTNVHPPTYKLLREAGKGATVFSIDSGIDPDHPDFAQSYDKKYFYKVPNEKMGLPEWIFVDNPEYGKEGASGSTLSKIQKPYVPDPDGVMKDASGHGTCVGSLSTGLTSGAAKKARLVPVKYRNTKGSAALSAVIDAWSWVIDEVVKKNKNPEVQPGWAVVNLSQGYSKLGGLTSDDAQPPSEKYPNGGPLWQAWHTTMEDLLETAWSHDIVTVIAAGNFGSHAVNFDMKHQIPANLGTKDNALITVGGVDVHGNHWAGTTAQKGDIGSITLSALAEGVVCAKDGGKFAKNDGTSVASPVVAGLAAYLLSLPPLFLPKLPDGKEAPDLHEKGKVAMNVKLYMEQLAFPRVAGPPPGPKVAYNGEEASYCSVNMPELTYMGKDPKPNHEITRRAPTKAKTAAKADVYGMTPLGEDDQMNCNGKAKSAGSAGSAGEKSKTTPVKQD